MIYLPLDFACLCGATPNGHMMRFFKIYPNWRKFSTSDPTKSYVEHGLLTGQEQRPRLLTSPLKLSKKHSAIRKVFIEKLESKFKNCCAKRIDQQHFGWVAENGNEILLTFWRTTWSPNSRSRRWTEITASGSIYMPEKFEVPTAQDLWDIEAEYDKFLIWLYDQLFEGSISWNSARIGADWTNDGQPNLQFC